MTVTLFVAAVEAGNCVPADVLGRQRVGPGGKPLRRSGCRRREGEVIEGAWAHREGGGSRDTCGVCIRRDQGQAPPGRQ